MPDEEHDLEVTPGGPSGAPRAVLIRVARAITYLVIALLVIWGISLVANRLPSSTTGQAVVFRSLLGIAIGIVLVVVVRRMMRSLGEAPPAPPQKVDARPAEIVYECSVCGTRLRLEVAATVKPPKHCGEEMEAKIG